MLQYRGWRDLKISATGIEVRTGRKWSATLELATAEARLRHRALVGAVVRGRAGFGCFPLTLVQQGPGKQTEATCSGGSEGSRGGDKNQQNGRHETAGGMDEMGERSRAEAHLG